MSITPRVTNWLLRRVFQTLCRIDINEFKKVPRRGPYIMVANHVNFLEVPVVMCHLDHPVYTGFAKKETWDNPLFNFLFNQWGAIPINRGNIDRAAFQQAAQALGEGRIMAIAPEGTRSKDGRLQPGKPGVVALALRCQAPLLPVAFYGYENFWVNFKRLRRSDFHLAVGEPFHLKLEGDMPSREVRQAITDEIMYKIAEILPEKYRGCYHFSSKVQYRYLRPASS